MAIAATEPRPGATFVPQYGFGIRMRHASIAQARAALTEALAAEGFGVISEIDMQATLAKKLGVEMPPYLILGACNPALARLAIEREPYVGLFLPCNVTLWLDDDEVVVTVASPVALLGLAGDARLAGIAREAERRLKGALERIVT
jgi:uncharacterized protein (DUF302 family)